MTLPLDSKISNAARPKPPAPNIITGLSMAQSYPYSNKFTMLVQEMKKEGKPLFNADLFLTP